MPPDVLAHAHQLARGVEEPRRVEPPGRGKRALRLAEADPGSDATTSCATSSGLSTRGALTCTASIAPFPQTPHEDEV